MQRHHKLVGPVQACFHSMPLPSAMCRVRGLLCGSSCSSCTPKAKASEHKAKSSGQPGARSKLNKCVSRVRLLALHCD